MGIPAIEPYPMPGAADLPDNIAAWTVDPDRAVLLVHDMQRYFLRPFPDQLRRASSSQQRGRLRDRVPRRGVPVAYTAQPGGMTDEQRGLLKDFWGPGMRVDPADRRGRRRRSRPPAGRLGVHQVALQRVLPLRPARADARGRAATSWSCAASTPTSAC